MKARRLQPYSAISFEEIERCKGISAKTPFYDGDRTLWKPPATVKETSHPRLQPVVDSVLDLVGNTPMIRLSRFAAAHGLKCQLLGKCEFFNPGGSIKDRVAKEMVLRSKEDGTLKEGVTVIEASSGNAGIGLALISAVVGHKMAITMADKMSIEKEILMRLLGAQLIRTPNVPWDDPQSNLCIVEKIKDNVEQVYRPDQYLHDGNPMGHYLYTAGEILQQCSNKVDMVVMGAGTGGTLTGVGCRLRETVPNCKIIGVDPQGSMLALPDSLNTELFGQNWQVEGLGYEFVPDILNRTYVDQWVKTDDTASFRLARELMQLEGLLCGGSAGSALQAALVAAKDLDETQTCVVVIPDGIRNYMTTFGSDTWMTAMGHMEIPRPPPSGFPLDKGVVGDLPITKIQTTFKRDVLYIELLEYFSGRESQETEVAVLADESNSENDEVSVVGYVSKSKMLTAATLQRLKPISRSTTVTDCGIVSVMTRGDFVTKDVSVYEVLLRLQDELPNFVFVCKDTVTAALPQQVACEGVVTKQNVMKYLFTQCPA
eukprot:Lankesteria_metandrocarpae@DN5344_c0_g1_i2.p1